MTLSSTNSSKQTQRNQKRPKGGVQTLEQLTTLEYQGIRAELKHGIWHSSDAAFAKRLTELSLMIGYTAADPNPDATIARGIAARLGARLVQVGFLQNVRQTRSIEIALYHYICFWRIIQKNGKIPMNCAYSTLFPWFI